MKIKFKDDLNKANLIVIKDEETENYEYAFAQPPMEIELEDDLNKATLINIKDEETEEYGNIFAQPIDYIDSSHYVAQPHLKFKSKYNICIPVSLIQNVYFRILLRLRLWSVWDGILSFKMFIN